MFLYLQNADQLVCSDHKPLLKFFIGHTDSNKCNTQGLQATAIPRRVKVQNIKSIANVFADSASRHRAVGLYHDIDLKDYQHEFSAPFESLPLEVNKAFITPNIKKCTQTYNALHDLPTGQTNDDVKLSLQNTLPADIPQLEQNLMSLPELTSEKVIKVQKNDTFCKNIIQHVECSKHDNYSMDATGILHTKVIDFNSTFSAIVITQILKNTYYMLHMTH